ncbi:lytic transglycosylase domain-containing protein [Kocuria sp.]|uniref:lytic transglycosylase domain-containing protein n=1 Tax=Kocuria sp. TaxID=1871328 RepID=UPI0026E092B7|nr:transglycosylase SLT domain-containing protein [Kocuria sp.]MDO5617827.1 transglycosylase SLT domain-containing protein [Kocuria sp.]
MSASSAKKSQKPKGNKPQGSASQTVKDNWIALTAVGLLSVGAVGAVIQNMNPACVDRNGVIPRQWADDVVAAAEVSGFSPSVVAAQIHTESAWDPEAESPVGALGLAQFMPETWEIYGQGDIADPEASIQAQGYYLRDLRNMMAGLEPANEQEELDLVLASYNAGPTVVLEEGGIPNFQETENYVSQINELAATRYANVCSAE